MKAKETAMKANELYKGWKQQEAEIRDVFPEFSLEEALKDDKFRSALMAGQTVFEAGAVMIFNQMSPQAQELAIMLYSLTDEELAKVQPVIEEIRNEKAFA